MRDLETLKFSLLPDVVLDGVVYSIGNVTAGYVSAEDTIYLTTDSIRDVVHELCERDLIDLIGEARERNHIMSPFKSGNWGKWRLWGARQ